MSETTISYQAARAIVDKLYTISLEYGNTNEEREGWVDWALARMRGSVQFHAEEPHARIRWCHLALGWTDLPLPHNLHFCLTTYAIRDRAIPASSLAGFSAAAALRIAPHEYDLLAAYLRQDESRPWEHRE